MAIPRRLRDQAGRYALVDGIPFQLPVISQQSPALMAVFPINAEKATALVKEMVRLALELYEQPKTRVTTSELNQALEEALSLHRTTRRKVKSPKIYYTTQVSVSPPTFVLFVNDPKLFDSDYERYLSNQLRRKLPFSEVPMQFHFRARTKVQLSHP